jgi:hypothetical protein
LIGGIAAWYAGKVRIIGVEPVLALTLTKRWGSVRRCACGWHRRRFTGAEAGR